MKVVTLRSNLRKTFCHYTETVPGSVLYKSCSFTKKEFPLLVFLCNSTDTFLAQQLRVTLLATFWIYAKLVFLRKHSNPHFHYSIYFRA